MLACCKMRRNLSPLQKTSKKPRHKAFIACSIKLINGTALIFSVKTKYCRYNRLICKLYNIG